MQAEILVAWGDITGAVDLYVSIYDYESIANLYIKAGKLIELMTILWSAENSKLSKDLLLKCADYFWKNK